MNNIWVYIFLFIDLIILVLAVVIYTRKPSSNDSVTVGKDMESLVAVMRQVVDEAEAVSKKLDKQIETGKDVVATINERSAVAMQYKQKKIDIEANNPLPLEEKEKYKQVSQLATKGTSIKEIARRLDLPEGEVELIVNLRRGF